LKDGTPLKEISAPNLNWDYAGEDDEGDEKHNIVACLTYLPLFWIGVIVSIVFLLIEPYKKKPFVRFHAIQSLLLSAAMIGFYILFIILSFVDAMFGLPIFSLLYFVVSLGAIAFTIFCMVKAYQGKVFKLPYLGEFAYSKAYQEDDEFSFDEVETKFCPRCQQRYSDKNKFCKKDGAVLQPIMLPSASVSFQRLRRCINHKHHLC
jgi:uncharacterized membrane protein